MLDEPTRWLMLSSDLFCHHPERQYKSCLSHALFTPVHDTQSSNTWYPRSKLLTVLTKILEESSRGREVEREDNSWAILKT